MTMRNKKQFLSQQLLGTSKSWSLKLRSITIFVMLMANDECSKQSSNCTGVAETGYWVSNPAEQAQSTRMILLNRHKEHG